ncbi:hypothetical protein Tco_1000517 [Tanacetum coccineum]
MLTKPQVFYDNAHKQALGYQNPFYIKKAQPIKPTLYDGSVISEKHVVMPVIDDEETLILEEVSRSKMLAKQNDPISKEKKVNTTLINYVELNKLSKDFSKRFVLQQELSTEQAFWFHMSNPSIESSDASPVKVEAPSELLKVSLVNESLKKLKFHLAEFDSVVKIRTTHDALIEDLLNEIMEVQTVFNQMEAVIEQCLVDKQCFEIVKKKIFLENDRLLQNIMSQDVLLTVMNYMSLNGDSMNVEMQRSESCDKCFNLDVELPKTQNAHNDLLKSYTQLEKHCISLELSIQLNQESFQKDKSYDNQNAFEIPKYFENNDLKAQLKDKDTTICKLKFFKEHVNSIKQTRVRTKEHIDSLIDKLNLKSVENEDLKAQIQDKIFVITSLKNDLRKLKGKEIVDNAAQLPNVTTIVSGMFKLDLDPLAPRLLQNREAHIDYLKYTQEQADILRGIVEQAKAKQPLDNALDFAYSNTPVLSSTGLKCSTSNYGSKPTGNKKNDRISQQPSWNMKNKVEAQPRKVNKKNRVVEPIRDADVKHSLLNVNSELICTTCNKCMFEVIHDMCLLNFVKNVNGHAKSAKKHKK